MKANYVFVLMFWFAASSAQNITFADPYLKTRLTGSLSAAFDAQGTDFSGDADIDNNGEISMQEAALVTGINIMRFPSSSSPFITSAVGLEHFTNLRTLRISGHHLTSLDVSMMPMLSLLHCGNNQLSALNVAGLSQLIELSCGTNALENLDLTGLATLEKLICYDNDLTGLDLAQTPALVTLWASGNPFGTLDVTGSQLSYLYCMDCALTGIEVQNVSTLNELLLNNNQLTALAMDGLQDLRYLDVSSNQLNNLDLSPIPLINSLTFSNNPITQIDLDGLWDLSDVDASQTNLTNLDCSQTSAQRIWASGCPFLETINVKNSVISFSDPDMLYYSFKFDDLPSIETICVDPGEQGNLEYGLFNSNPDVQVYTGENCDQLLGTQESMAQGVRIYPNPAKDLLYYEGTDPGPAAIFNITGQKIWAGEVDKSIDVSGIPAGVYLIRFGNKSAAKFVKV